MKETHVGKVCLFQFTVPYLVPVVGSGGINLGQSPDGKLVQMPAMPLRFDGEDAEYYYASHMEKGARYDLRIIKAAVAYITAAERNIVDTSPGGIVLPMGRAGLVLEPHVVVGQRLHRPRYPVPGGKLEVQGRQFALGPHHQCETRLAGFPPHGLPMGLVQQSLRLRVNHGEVVAAEDRGEYVLFHGQPRLDPSEVREPRLALFVHQSHGHLHRGPAGRLRRLPHPPGHVRGVAEVSAEVDIVLVVDHGANALAQFP